MQSNFFGSLKPLRDGARVALVAPAGVVRDLTDIARAEDNVRSFGWTPVLGTNVAAENAYLAGTDDERLHDINSAITSDDVDAIWCVRGGYGATRLLPFLDYTALRAHPKPLIGFSDITALHAAVRRECDTVVFHGPTARGELTPFSRASFECAVIDQRDSCGVAPEARVLKSGRAEGKLAGGNLALITSLLATPWSVQFDGSILIVEDIGEAVYRVDRMMRQLLLAGALQRCAGIIAGDFRAAPGETEMDDRTIDDVLTEAARAAGIPCLAGAPFGHIADQWTIPLGATAVLDTEQRSLRVTGTI
ncbi:MAG TPA: LD-carboxypeptidase [Gemmatimonadaceae bacterium]|nr:LD-carboxypeptidase [Gemmatimonadaceae bacterium]